MIVADIIGTIAFAISGVLIAVYKKLDIFGIFFVAYLTALGGGVIRDTVADRMPFAFTNYYPIVTVFITIVLTVVLEVYKKDIDSKFLFILSDAIGLCAFSITGAMVGIEVGFNIFGVIILAISTAVGGGLVRDMLLNEVPFILKEQVYATIAVFIAIVLFSLKSFDLINSISLSLLFFIALFIRLYTYKHKYHLPKL